MGAHVMTTHMTHTTTILTMTTTIATIITIIATTAILPPQITCQRRKLTSSHGLCTTTMITTVPTTITMTQDMLHTPSMITTLATPILMTTHTATLIATTMTMTTPQFTTTTHTPTTPTTALATMVVVALCLGSQTSSVGCLTCSPDTEDTEALRRGINLRNMILLRSCSNLIFQKLNIL